MNKDNITSIRILPSDKATFSQESEFRFFVENRMIARGGEYYFPNLMMNCPKNTFVLFQYDGMIRAIGVLIDLGKTPVVDERGVEYAGYYKFDIDTLEYLATPIDRDMLKVAYPTFKSFSQSKQIIPLEYLDDVLELLQNTNSVLLVDDSNIITEIENSDLEGVEKEALIKVRINQGVFRDKLLKKYSKCCLCGVCNSTFLIASHIKPWAESNSIEKLDIENGLLMCPNHDKLFDGGWITFNDEGNIIISSALQQNDKMFMNVKEGMNIELSQKNRKYIEYHRENIYKH